MMVDAIVDSDQLLRARYADFKTSQARRVEHEQEVTKWESSLHKKPRLVAGVQQVLGLGYPRFRKSQWFGNEGVIDALKQHPGIYPLKWIAGLSAYRVSFMYEFEYRIKDDNFPVTYVDRAITVQTTTELDPQLVIKEGQREPILHLPQGFRILIGGPYVYDRNNPDVGYWVPELTDAPVRVTLPEGLLHEMIMEFNSQRRANIYTGTQVVER